MFEELVLGFIQSATEYLPISSSGHLALVSNLFGNVNLFFFTALHLASLIAVLIYTRNEIKDMILFKADAVRLGLMVVLATIPSAIIGLLYNNLIESTFTSLFFLGFAFLFTSIVLFTTKFSKAKTSFISIKDAILIGLAQCVALFPGVSRSGMTISTALLLGIKPADAGKFSFLMFIPVSLGAFILELENAYIDLPLILSFILTIIFSLLFLNLLGWILKNNRFWIFSIYCLCISITTFIIALI